MLDDLMASGTIYTLLTLMFLCPSQNSSLTPELVYLTVNSTFPLGSLILDLTQPKLIDPSPW